MAVEDTNNSYYAAIAMLQLKDAVKLIDKITGHGSHELSHSINVVIDALEWINK